MAMDQNSFQKLLAFGVERGVSDVHFQVGYPPHYRLHGELLGAIKVLGKLESARTVELQDSTSVFRVFLADRGEVADRSVEN